MKYQEILNKGSQILRGNNIKSSNLDCELILSKVLKKTREEILINLNNKINKIQKNEFNFHINKRRNNNPISYILGATLLCTRRYELLEQKTNGEFKIEEYSREDLVVDMDLWSNRIKAFKLSLTL